MVEDLNGEEGVGKKRKHEGNNEEDIAEIIGVVKRQKPLENNTDLLSTVVAAKQSRRAQ